MLPKNPIYLLWGEEYSTPDLDDVDNAVFSPTPDSLGCHAEEFGRLSRGEEFPLEIHLIFPKSRGLINQALSLKKLLGTLFS